MLRRFIIFDRDGTLIRHVPYLSNTFEVALFEDTVTGLNRLLRCGYRFGIITNQSAIGRGYTTLENVNKVNEYLLEILNQYGINFDFVYLCPHIPEDFCSCRKPRNDLGKLAVEHFDIDSRNSFMVGDQPSDFEFGVSLGFQSIAIRNSRLQQLFPKHYFPDLDVFSDWVEKGGHLLD